MFPVILFRRTWLLWGLLLVAWQLGATWAVDRWSSWEWVRAAAPVLAWVVCVGVALWGAGTVLIVTRRGFWSASEGRGRWSDVVARDDLDLTFRVSTRFGVDRIVSFDQWDGRRIRRVLDARLPAVLPGRDATEPDPIWRAEVEKHADELIGRVNRRIATPESTRYWTRPRHDFGVHRLAVEFEPAADGARVGLEFDDEWGAVVRVDGCYAYLHRGIEDDEEDGGLDESDRAVELLEAVFGSAPREPLTAWRTPGAGRLRWDFYPRPPDELEW